MELYIDLMKSWREAQHPRDTFGKFSTVKGGSRVVTKNGKAGTVQEAGATHHKVRYDDGKLGTVAKDNVLHEKDHDKVVAQRKKDEAAAKRKKSAAAKSKATKTANKTNANGKTGAGKTIADPTAKGRNLAKPAAKLTVSATKPPVEKRRVPKSERDVVVPKKERDRAIQAPVLKRQTTHDESSREQEVKVAIPQTKKATGGDKANEQTKAAESYKMIEDEKGAETTHIDSMWNHPDVQKILAKPVAKRSAGEIRAAAGKITDANDKLARHVVHRMAAARGLHVLGNANVIKRHQGAKRSSEGKREAAANPNVKQETGTYADLLQSARGTMFQTLHNVLSGSQNPGKGTSIAAHTIQRMKQELHRDIYDHMNDIPAPHEIRQAIGDMKKHENNLSQDLGRTPTHNELAEHLEKHSDHFKNAPIVKPPHFDEGKGEWVNTNKRYEDPAEKLRALKNYHAQQKVTSIDNNAAGGNGEDKAVSIKDAASDRTDVSPEQRAVEKERQSELKGALPKAMRAMGLTDDEIKVLSVMFSQTSETGNKTNLTGKETTQRLNDEHGLSMTENQVEHHQRKAMKKLAAARAENHPALEQLRMLKSLMVNAMLKKAYEFDLVKSLHAWGVDISVMEQEFVRTLYADSTEDLMKSIEPHEYVGSYVVLDDGDVIANLTQFTLPGDNELYKSFNAFHNGLRKSMFPHTGTKHAVNEKATAYVKANAKKYKALSESQHSATKSKGGKGHTWSEELLLKNPGSCWITWGGRKILVNGSTGDILYNSGNDTHREEHNQGAQEDKIDFHHEKEALDQHEESRDKATHDAWKAHISDKEKKAGKSANTLDYGKEREAFAKKNRGASFDDAGNMQFSRDNELNDDNRHVFDHGVGAFRDQMEDMKQGWNGTGGHKEKFRAHSAHKALDVYSELSDEERAKMDAMGTDEAAKKEYLGKHFLAKEGVKEALQNYHDTYKSGVPTSEAEAAAREALKGIGSVAGRNTDMMTAFLKDVAKMNPSASEGNMDALAESFGTKEMSRAKEEANKKLIPEGKYLLGNPITGKTMVVHIGGDFTGGRGSRKKDADGNEERGKYASVIAEAFDPDGGNHEELTSWGQLGKALGYTGKDADNLKEVLTQHANKDSDKPFLKPISDSEFDQQRAKTKAGLQDSMLHKEFKLVDQQRDNDGKIKAQTFAQKMPDGTTNHISTDAEGMITDPLMRRLLNQRKPITNEKEANELLKTAAGNRAWVTAHFGGDIHIGDALGHHVQLEYDGKGAPRVVGGTYDGYRYMDSSAVPKGATDPATGEPIKALFKNGKLVDRRYSTQNDVAMKEGNAVMYPSGDGKFKKGRIHSQADGGFKVTDGNGHVIGVFSTKELKPAKETGRILSNSGQAAVKVAKNGTHRMNVGESFANEKPQAKALFEEALRKAKVNKAFDDDGNLKNEIELSDAMHRNLTKVLGRSKAGKSMLQKFNSAHTHELEIHVPENLRAQVESEGVKVLNNGTARISAGKFEQLRDSLGGMSLTHDAQEHMKDHFARKDRTPKEAHELKAQYQPSTIKSGRKDGFDDHFKAQFKGDSYLMNKDQGLYGTQLEGVSHLVERGRGIAGHGMGTGKTILGVVAGLHYKADMLAKGEKPKKTLIVSPKGIMSDWGKEIGSHTNSKGLFIGSGLKGVKNENGRNMWGQSGNEQEAVDFKSFKKNSAQHASEDHDFHMVNYDTFMRNRDHFAGSGMYDNIVIDEVHAFKNQKGKRGTALAETTDKFKNVWGLSGTPMENDAREAYSLIDTVTGGKHELGSMKEFTDNYMQKDRNGKIIGIKPTMSEKLGDIMANVVQFRGGEDVTYNDGSKIHFPHLTGQTSEDGSAPKTDFIGNMVDRNRDHKTNNYYGTKHSVTDFETESKTVTNAKNGESYEVTTTKPKNLTPDQEAMYKKYNELQEKYLPESKRAELATAAATGIDQGQKGSQNYLTAMQKLQKFLNAPLSHRMYVGGGDALESDATDVQGAGGTGDKKKATGLKEGEHYTVDKDGYKRYFESDGAGGYLKEKDGSPRLLPPLHKNNPKAQYLQDRIHKYLDGLQAENKERVKRGDKPMVPKLVVKSSYTTFGTDIIDNVLKDVKNTHPIFHDLKKQGFHDLKKQGFDGLGQGRFTGEATDREDTKVGFRGNKHDYTNNQGNLWATTVSPAGKEGVDFGNAHAMFHFDQDWNPQKMAQFTARVRRSDSAKTHNAMNRANSVRVESLHMPNTVEDFMFNAQDAKIKGVEDLTSATRTAEKYSKMGETESKLGRGNRGFTSKKKPRQPQDALRKPKAPKELGNGGDALRKLPAASADKALKLVILL